MNRERRTGTSYTKQKQKDALAKMRAARAGQRPLDQEARFVPWVLSVLCFEKRFLFAQKVEKESLFDEVDEEAYESLQAKGVQDIQEFIVDGTRLFSFTVF